MRRKPDLAASDMNELKMATFKDGQPEEFLALLNNLKITINGTGNTPVEVQMNYLCTMLCEEALREFEELSSQNNGTKIAHLKHITEVLLGYFSRINALSKQKCAMLRVMCKLRDLPFKSFAKRLTELNNYLPLFTVSSYTNNTPPPEYNNKILLHAVTNGWAK